MRIPRLFHPTLIENQQRILLSPDAVGHISRVLRMSAGHKICLFDGSGYEHQAIISEISKKSVEVTIESKTLNTVESPLDIELGQVISRGDKMEFTIQKSVELGVNIITPLLSERCGVKLDPERFEKKRQQWQKIAIAACEQSGRNIVPLVRPVQSIESWCKEHFDGLKLTLHPRAKQSINTLTDKLTSVRLLIGPEGGLTDAEILMTKTLAFNEILLGPRVLRTETAALCAITALQVRFGDLG